MKFFTTISSNLKILEKKKCQDVWSPENDFPYVQSDWPNDTEDVTFGLNELTQPIYNTTDLYENAA